MSKSNKEKIIAVVGTTASGKTSLAVALALEFGGEVISADSRQVYKYMDIGSGKDLHEYVIVKNGVKKNIPYHLIDVAHPNEKYDLAKWLDAAKLAVKDVSQRTKLPIVAGGTGLYVQALLDGYKLSEASADPELRKKLEISNTDDLYKQLYSLDKKFAQSLNESERANKRRLIRHIEIITSSNNYNEEVERKSSIRPYDDLILGLAWPREAIRDRIYKRIVNRIENEAMIEEVKMLHDEHDVPWERLESFGLEYKYLSYYLRDKIGYDEMINKLHSATCQFAKRQMTWLRRWEKQGAKIHWIDDKGVAINHVREFLEN